MNLKSLMNRKHGVRSTDKWILKKTINQSSNQSIHPSISLWISQWINQSINRTMESSHQVMQLMPRIWPAKLKQIYLIGFRRCWWFSLPLWIPRFSYWLLGQSSHPCTAESATIRWSWRWKTVGVASGPKTLWRGNRKYTWRFLTD